LAAVLLVCNAHGSWPVRRLITTREFPSIENRN
jgi:hypothetical protein